MPTLFMVKIGGRPKGRLIEQHDMFFGVGERIGDFIEAINLQWPEVKNTWHLDAYRQVTIVDNYRIQWQPVIVTEKLMTEESMTEENAETLKLFFINLGGYLAGEFEEYHHKLLIVAPTQTDAIKQAKKSTFYKQYSFNDKNTPFNAASHIDDKHQVDVDEIYDVNDLLTGGRLSIVPLSETHIESVQEDKSYIGYLSLKKLRKLSESGDI